MRITNIGLEVTRHQHESGRWYLEYTPVLHPDVCASGRLTFAVWQVWEDEPETHLDGKRKATDSAIRAMEHFVSELKKYQETPELPSTAQV